MPIYNKLVRDLIPQVIDSNVKKFSTKILNEEEYIKELKKKAYEELEEYMSADNHEDALEELADVLEVVHALAEYHGASFESVEEIRTQKVEKRGGFKERVFLVEVEDQ
ncbi:nucleoside triphosphate pyrophosphohydrolase [Neobacillus sp. PS3-34]|uniref:nucleoside triphosphate pyrophosphohydrolase n=1 Tax=Neobacillus sp. PS3-34 TaxID=3070678 RepID=UPI0027E0AE14|nr:nucleoside triphosphate pyrophosphohydrolase [Neobacillus sp. PS3-34]WML48480.1 nucleoside triphosphate pyrophosphohydrolase [Neobacillus sp. PS3-34]